MMKGLIVAGVAGLAGVAGVVGLSNAATGGGGEPEPATSVPALTRTATTSTQPSLEDRLADVRRAERAADRALSRTAPAAPVAPAATTSGRTVTAPRSGDDDGTFDQGPGDRDPVTGAFLDDDHRVRGDDDDGHRGRGRDDDDDDDGGHGFGRGGDDD